MNAFPELSLDLDGRTGSVPLARRATWHFLHSLGRGDRPAPGLETQRDVVLVVSELVGNACRHAPGPCRLTVSQREDAVDVAVEDTSTELIETSPLTGAYGLRLVGSLARGVHVVRTVGGKIVYATVAATPRRFPVSVHEPT